MNDVPGSNAGFDRAEPNARAIAVFGVATMILLVVVVLGLQFYFDRTLEQQVYVQVLAPESQALTALRAREDEELHTYRFLDRDKGIVRLPVERAIELLAAESAQNRLRYPTRPAPVPPGGATGGPNVSR